MTLVLAILITWFVGPLAFYIITGLNKSGKLFPASLTGAVGDTIFLPIFNGLAVYCGVFDYLTSNLTKLRWALLITLVFSILYLEYRRKIKKHDGWMYNQKGNFNFAGWYHFIYVVLQLFVIVVSLLYCYNQIWLWMVLLGYAITTRLKKYSRSGGVSR